MVDVQFSYNCCKLLQDNGYDGVYVGGYIRDKYLGLDSHDIDISTNATPDEVITLFTTNGYKVIPVGLEFGTVLVMKNLDEITDDDKIEVTTYRNEGLYKDQRHPVITSWETDLTKDLSRRDFTINAMAYNPISNTFIDPHSGMDDIDNRIIRCVGNPLERFREDPLRMLRMVRFASRFNFKIDHDTWNATKTLANQVQFVSSERIRDEILKTLQGNVPRAMTILHTTGLLKYIMSEMDDTWNVPQPKQFHRFNVFYHSCYCSQNLPEDRPLLRLAGLLHDTGKIEMADKSPYFANHEVLSAEISRDICRRLKFSNKDTAYVSTLARFHMENKNYKNLSTDKAIRRFIRRFNHLEWLDDLFLIHKADLTSMGYVYDDFLQELDDFKQEVCRIINERPPFSAKDLKINGHDLMDIDIPANRMMGEILQRLVDEIVDYPSLNNRDYLLERAKEIFNELQGNDIQTETEYSN